ncbi:MAG: hypothetical protein ACTSSE_08525 [Candidatus Thorarchaeota archaeon]
MTEYPYTKASVNATKLTMEIEANEIIVTDLQYINWKAPDALSIFFDGTLGGGEETALDTLVSNHDGNPPTTYSRYCICCNRHYTEEGISAPTACPYCSSTMIKVDECEYPKELEADINADGGYDGVVVKITAGENLVFPNVAYLKSDGKYWKTDNDAIATSTGKVVMILETIDADASGKALKTGKVRNDAWTWTTKGARLYIDHIHGALTETKPDTTDYIGRCVADITENLDIIDFCPDTSYVVVP